MAGSSTQSPNLDNEDVPPPSSSQVAQPPCTTQGRPLKSKVWQYMDREVLSNGVVKATCQFCKNVFTANSNSGTSHLKRHIENCALRFNCDVRNFCMSAPPSDAGSPSLSLRSVVNLEEVRKAICVYIVAGAHPFTTCEEPGFRYMVSTMCPQFNNVSRHTIRRDAMKYYNDEKQLVRDELQKVPGRICFTTDNWRSENTGDEFMCITAHWVDYNWKLQKRIIKFGALVPPFDGESLAEEIQLCLGQWKIDHKVFSFTLDNASYNDTMINSLRSHLLRKHALLLHGQFFHMHCACHIINLVVQAGLKVVDEVVIKIRNVVKHLKHSISKRKKFYEIAQTSFGLSTTKRLRGDTCIRWNSTFLMLDRFLYFRDVIDQQVGKDKDIKMFGLNQDEWKNVSELHSFLKIFYDVTNSFSASKTPTSNVYFYGVWRIHRKLLEVFDNTQSCLFVMAMEMQEKFNKYWSDYNLILSCAAVLDPRFKLEGVEYCYEKLFGETYAKEMTITLKDTLFELFDEYKGAFHVSSPGVGTSLVGTPDASRQDGMIGCFGSPNDAVEFQAFLNKRRKVDNEKSEFELYFEEKIKNLDSIVKDGDVLAYWKNNSERYPCLSSMARDILTIPISTVPSESAFSMGKKLINPWRSSLSSKIIESLACLEDWYRAKGLTLGPSLFFGYSEETTADGDDEDDEDEDDLERDS